MSSQIDALLIARHAVENGKSTLAFRLLNPLIAAQVPEALYLGSCIAKVGESDAEFLMRRFWLLNQAARLKHPDALYILGVHFDCGDGVLKNSAIASAFFEQAALFGHSRAKLSFGLDLIYGSNRVARDYQLGLRYVREAAAEGVEDAAKLLAEIESSQGRS